MRGLVFDISVPRYLLSKAAGGAFPSVHYGPLSGLRLREVAKPRLPDETWVRLKPRATGLCGSDLSTLLFKQSPQLEPFNSFPAVLGHEVVAEVVELGAKARGVEVGQRVALNPLLPCALRGLTPPCHACAAGEERGCENVAEGCLAPGQMIGFHRELPGGFGAELVAHPSQLFAVPDAIDDRRAVLMEPLSVALHAVLKAPPDPADEVLIIGGGPVAFSTLWAIRALGYTCHVTLMAAEEYQRALAMRLGATETLGLAPDREEAAEVARRTGGRTYQPIIGPPVITGGYSLIFDCVGNATSVQDALRYGRSFARIVLIGAAGILARVDWTSVWRREQTILGSYTYGRERFRGESLHTFEVARTLLEEEAGPDAGQLVTHRFSLEQYREAVKANLDRKAHRSVKTIFTFA